MLSRVHEETQIHAHAYLVDRCIRVYPCKGRTLRRGGCGDCSVGTVSLDGPGGVGRGLKGGK